MYTCGGCGGVVVQFRKEVAWGVYVDDLDCDDCKSVVCLDCRRLAYQQPPVLVETGPRKGDVMVKVRRFHCSWSKTGRHRHRHCTGGQCHLCRAVRAP